MTTTALQARPAAESGMTEFIPYGGADKIKLSVNIVKSLVAVPTKSGRLCTDRDAIRFIALCTAKRLNPFEGDAFLIGFDGKNGPEFNLITAHQAFLKRAELHPEYDGMESGVIVAEEDGTTRDLEGDYHAPNQKVLGGWATVFFKNRKHPNKKRLRLSRFQKPWGVWQDDPGGMICKCAEADALRSAFPTMLGGLYMADEVAIGRHFEQRQISDSPPFTAHPQAAAELQDANSKPQTEPADQPAKRKPGRPARAQKPEPQQQPQDDTDDGDMGPTVSAADNPAITVQEELMAELDGVPFDDFRDFAKVQFQMDLSHVPEYGDLTIAQCMSFLAYPKALARCRALWAPKAAQPEEAA